MGPARVVATKVTRIAPEPADQQREDGQRVGVGRVQVVDCEHDGFGGRPPHKELFERTDEPGQWHRVARRAHVRGGERLPQLGREVERRGVAFGHERVSQRGVDRRERDVAVELVEPARQDPVAEHVGLFEHCSEEPRLPDPGLAADDDHRRGTGPGGLQRLDPRWSSAWRPIEHGPTSPRRYRRSTVA